MTDIAACLAIALTLIKAVAHGAELSFERVTWKKVSSGDTAKSKAIGNCRVGESRMAATQNFVEALISSQRAADISESSDIFAFLIGSWRLDAVLYDADGKTRRMAGELHASWVLEGRAIQDLFIFPARVDRRSDVRHPGDRYATTLRTYDRRLDAWRINFINPAAEETSARLLARRDSHGISMEGQLLNGTVIRWAYTDITDTSFHYSAERLETESGLWRLYLELFGQPILPVTSRANGNSSS
jgi:hypothetical protein